MTKETAYRKIAAAFSPSRILTAILFGQILVAVPAMGATENLDELMARKARFAAATWSNTLLENAALNYYWQPETVSYSDVTTGNEIWRISNTPGRYNAYHSDISMSPWSANGNRLAFKSDRNTGAFNRSTYRLWLVTNADGSRMRPIAGAPARVDYHTYYFHWSPKYQDVFFEMGKTAAGNTSAVANVLYKATVGDASVSKTALVTLPTTKGTDLKLFKTVSADGNKAIVGTNDESWLFPVTLTDGIAGLDVPAGYTSNRSMGGTWGDTPTTYTSYHDAYYPGDGSYLYFLPSGSHAWWKNKVLGSAPDGGSIYSFISPNIFGEQIPVNTVSGWGGTRDPFGSPYWSHFTPDRWGRYAQFTNTDASVIGPSVWDITNAKMVVNTFGGGAQHHDWSSFSDWNASSRGPTTTGDYSADRLYTQNFTDASSQQTIGYTHTLYNNGGVYKGSAYEYDAIPRPAQSPDGTKVAYHSTFLNIAGSYDNLPDVFWAVAYYPYPPEIKSAAKVSSGVRLTWDYNQGTTAAPNHINPRTYTTRGWPNEVTDRPSSPREVDKFRIWGSPDGKSWSRLGTTAYNNCRGQNQCGAWTESSWYFDAAQPNGSTRYYAITSIEYSGLESRTLGNIWMVALGNDGSITLQGQQSAYPSDPGGKGNFYTAPPPPVPVTVTYMEAPASAAGQYTLKWNAPQNSSMIRYYNIYAKDGIAPFTTATAMADRQKARIASVPASSDYSGTGSFRYVDWLGATDGSTKYIVTAVDFQGNETVAVGIPAPPVIRLAP